MPVVRHRLTDIDAENRKAVCSVCGETRIRYRENGRSECMTVRNANKFGAGNRDEQLRRRRLRERYKLTTEEFDELRESQAGRCAICRKEDSSESGLVVDHDHRTGRVRGLLCNGCNVGLGFLQDDHEVLTAAAAYLVDFSRQASSD